MHLKLTQNKRALQELVRRELDPRKHFFWYPSSLVHETQYETTPLPPFSHTRAHSRQNNSPPVTFESPYFSHHHTSRRVFKYISLAQGGIQERRSSSRAGGPPLQRQHRHRHPRSFLRRDSTTHMHNRYIAAVNESSPCTRQYSGMRRWEKHCCAKKRNTVHWVKSPAFTSEHLIHSLVVLPLYIRISHESQNIARTRGTHTQTARLCSQLLEQQV